MREIKFRFYSNIFRQICEVFRIDFESKVICHSNPLNDEGELSSKEDEGILLEFINCFDKVGRPIFEGDILKFWNIIGFVYWNQGECGPCQGESVGCYILCVDLIKPLRGAIHNSWNGNEVEVIGNIHENPELIRGEKGA